MKITGDLKIKEVLALNEVKMISTLMWLAPEFERLRYPKLHRAMAGRVSVSQAARIGRIPLTEILYVLNLALGENEAELSKELKLCPRDDFQYTDANVPVKPAEIATTKDTDINVVFVDLMRHADEKRDPMPAIAKGLVSLKQPNEILLSGIRSTRYRCGICLQGAALRVGPKSENRVSGLSTFTGQPYGRPLRRIRK